MWGWSWGWVLKTEGRLTQHLTTSWHKDVDKIMTFYLFSR